MKQLSRNLFLVALLSVLASFTSFAQKTVAITVKDQMGPVPGVNILIKGTTTGAMTDMDGIATITAKDSDVLRITCIGYADQEVKVGSQSKINVLLVEDTEVLEETVVVGYGTQKKASLTSSIVNLRTEELTATKQNDVVASLQGKVPGLQIRQQSGSPGDFDTELNLRGMGSPIVVIDGVVRTAQRRNGFWNANYSTSSSALLASLNPEDIESISVLKDASASLYGIGSENGVIVVTTKQGSVGKPSVRYSNNIGFGVPTALPTEVGIIDWMNIANEMNANVGRPPKYSEEMIQHFVNGDKGYNDNNHYSMLMKDHSFQQTHNVSISGGNAQTQYYISGNFNQDKGILNNPELGYHRFNFQGNVTTQITENLKVNYQSSFNYSKRHGLPANVNMNIFYYALLSDRALSPTVVDDPNHWTYMAQAEGRNVIAIVNGLGGHDDTYMQSYTNNIDVKYTVPQIKGLVLNAYASYETSTRQTNALTLAFPLYDYWSNTLVGQNGDQNEYSENWNKNSTLYGKLQANYNKKFGQHNLGAMFAMEARKGTMHAIGASRRYGDFFTHDIISQGDASTATNSGSRTMSATAGYLGRVNWDYKGKYLAEVMARYDGTYLYAHGHRWGFFPSYSLGWRVSEEEFFKSVFPAVNNLKIRWSDGITGGSQGSPYGYLLGYTQNGNYVYNPGGQVGGYVNNQVAQTLISWTDNHLMDIGVDWEVKNGLFGGSIDWFWRNTTGISAKSTNTVPDMYGLQLPNMNLNARQNVGIDLALQHRYHIGKLNYRMSGTLTFSRQRMTHIESEKTAQYYSAQHYYDSHTEGRWNTANGGKFYDWKGGQFANYGEINSYPVMYNSGSANSQMLPGMYKIDDRDGDGYITGKDQYPSWPETNAPLQFGFMLFLNYKNFDLSASFSGSALVHKSVSLSGGMGYGFFQTFYESYTDRYQLASGYTDPLDPNSQWTSGVFPALAPAAAAYDNWSNATYRYNQPYSWVNATFLRLKSLEIGYNVPAKVLKPIGLKNARIFTSGTNLLTFCNKFLKPYDPERANSQYLGVLGTPLLKTFTIGVNLSF